VNVRPTGRFFSALPARLAVASVTAAVLSVVFWYLASPLFVRTYKYEELPSPAAVTTDAPVSSAAPAAASPRVLRSGELGFVDQIHNGKGPVRIVDIGGTRYLRFDDVMLTNAPDVHVYLSRATGGQWAESTSLYLGPLKATNGSFNYEIPDTADVESYQSVVVWCRAFHVLISWADLRVGAVRA
jgi:Electron transfer DM13